MNWKAPAVRIYSDKNRTKGKKLSHAVVAQDRRRRNVLESRHLGTESFYETPEKTVSTQRGPHAKRSGPVQQQPDRHLARDRIPVPGVVA